MFKKLAFKVDSALLRELGERLVGRPHIALAELIKNSYDADATRAVITFEADSIVVEDDGHGMTFEEFNDFWMRIGSPHKEKLGRSRKLNRPLTGSKGIGRLSVQFLGEGLEMRTVSAGETSTELVAKVDWREAVHAGNLTEAVARYDEVPAETRFAGRSRSGTRLTLTRLNHRWTAEEFEELAREIWPLQPPFDEPQAAHAFYVDLKSPNQHVVDRFKEQMRAILDIWHARLDGHLLEDGADTPGTRKVRLQLRFSDGHQERTTYDIGDCHLHRLDFQIRVFHLQHRQPKGIRVQDARDYLNHFGGVHVYDAGFHLPYYGADEDWLGIEMDHSHRLSRSKLLPERLQVEDGLSFLPTNSRLFGVVNVNTASERELSDEDSRDMLLIQVSRDRLVDNKSFRDLRRIVRWAIDYYAMQEAKRAYEQAAKLPDEERVEERADRLQDVLTRHRKEIPAPVYSTLRTEVRRIVRSARAESDRLAAQTGLLGALATAGIGALAYEHEVAKQFHAIRRIARTLQSDDFDIDGVDVIAEELKAWVKRAKATRALFVHLLDEENRQKVARFKARELADHVVKQVRPFLRGVTVRTSQIPQSWRLPEASYVEWSALLQNVFLNASNAMLGTDRKQLSVIPRTQDGTQALLVEDTGVGVDVATSHELFEPFVRRLEIPESRRAAGLGGSGLGLTIVRMLADSIGCRVRFVAPDDGFSTALQISWRKG